MLNTYNINYTYIIQYCQYEYSDLTKEIERLLSFVDSLIHCLIRITMNKIWNIELVSVIESRHLCEIVLARMTVINGGTAAIGCSYPTSYRRCLVNTQTVSPSMAQLLFQPAHTRQILKCFNRDAHFVLIQLLLVVL